LPYLSPYPTISFMCKEILGNSVVDLNPDPFPKRITDPVLDPDPDPYYLSKI
jgi:hypothetical protein